MPMHAIHKPVILAAMLLLGAGAGAAAMPVAASLGEVTAATPAQYNPGYHARRQYHRALRRYRGHPGAQFQLRQNRRIYCRNTPERC